MAERNVQIKLLSSNISNRPLPTNLLLGEAVVNTADGIVMFSGSSQGANSYEQLVDPSIPNATGGTYFEVGSNLYNLKIRNKITQYNGLSDLSGKFLSGTSEGFVLADISDIVTASNGLTDDGNNIKLGGILSENTVISGGSQTLDLGTSDSQISFLRINGIQAQEDYKSGGLGLEVTKNPGTFKTELDYTSTNGVKSTIYQQPDNILISSFGDSGDTESKLQVTASQINLMFKPSGQTGFSGLFLTKDNGYYFADGRENTAGIEYLADYSTGWTDNSLVTKKYVDDSIATLDAADTFVTGGTYDNATGDITFTQNDGSTFAVDLSALDLNDTVVTGATEIDGIVYFDTNDTASAFTADLTSLITNGNGTTANGTSVNLGGTLTSNVIIDGLSGTSSMFLGSNGPDQQLSAFAVGANDGISLFDYENNIIQSSLSLNSGNATLTSNSGITALIGKNVYANAYDNRNFRLSLTGGIAPGSGESFTLNGVTFTEGIDFVGQDDALLDAETIAGLVYTGVTDFLSVVYTNGIAEVLFNFATPATTSASLTNGYITENLFNTAISLTENGLFLTAGNTALVIGNPAGNNVFSDNTSNQAGIQYAADYSANFTDRSLVDKAYVDGEIAALDAADTFVTGGTVSYTNEAGTITFTNNDGSTFDVTGITDVQTTGGTYDNATGDITFTQNNGSTFTVDLSALDLNDTVVTGGTISYNNEAGTITFTNSDGSTFDVTGITDVQTTGATLNGSTATFTQNDGSTFDLDLSALDVNDTVVTGGTVSYVDEAGTITFTNNDGSTFDVTGITDVQTTGATLNGSTATFTQNDGSTYDLDLSALDVNDTFVTGFTYDNANTLTISRNEGEADLTVNISTFTGITISTLDANSIVYTDGSGKLTTEGSFSYDASTDTMTVGNITVQNGSGSTATFGQGGVTIGSNGIGDLTVQGDLIVLGDTTTVSTSELVVEDPTITINYSTGTTNATSLGAGIEIQDGDGAGTDLYLKIEELNTAYPSEYTSLTGAENRALYTNLNDIVIRQATDISSPSAGQVGKRVLAEDDILDSGSY